MPAVGLSPDVDAKLSIPPPLLVAFFQNFGKDRRRHQIAPVHVGAGSVRPGGRFVGHRHPDLLALASLAVLLRRKVFDVGSDVGRQRVDPLRHERVWPVPEEVDRQVEVVLG